MSSKLKIACIVAIAGAGTIARKPHHTAPVVRHAAHGERELVLMNWGFPLLQPSSRLVSVDDDAPASFPGRCVASATIVPHPHDCRPSGCGMFFNSMGCEIQQPRLGGAAGPPVLRVVSGRGRGAAETRIAVPNS